MNKLHFRFFAALCLFVSNQAWQLLFKAYSMHFLTTSKSLPWWLRCTKCCGFKFSTNHTTGIRKKWTLEGLLKSIQKCVGICKEPSLIIQSYRALVAPRAHRTALLRLTGGGVERPCPGPSRKTIWICSPCSQQHTRRPPALPPEQSRMKNAQYLWCKGRWITWSRVF